MDMPLPTSVQTVLNTLAQNGFFAVTVGGCVRDRCMGVTPHDYDVATEATPEQMRQCFSAFRTLDTGLRHGTLTVLVGHEPVEVTTFRVDGDYKDHRRPERVTFTTDLTRDLSRRDFTVNAMACDAGRLIDPFGGRDDLRRRLIRCVGDADQRFDEDALRILRAMRFAATLSFTVEARTADAMRRHRELLRSIAAERIWAEFQKLLRGENAPAVLAEFADVLRVFLPETDETGLRQSALSPPEPIVRLALLLQNADAARALERLRADKKTIRAVTQLLSMQPQPLRRMLSACPPQAVHGFWELRFARGQYSRADADALHRETDALLAQAPCLHVADLALNGSDLQRLGLRGAAIGQTLQALLDAVLDGELSNERGALLSAAEKMAAKS